MAHPLLPEPKYPQIQASHQPRLAILVRSFSTQPNNLSYHVCSSLKLSCLQPESQFAAAYTQGINKFKYWEPTYEDTLNLIAKLPGLASLIYRNMYHGGKTIEADPKLDWAANLAHMMGATRAS